MKKALIAGAGVAALGMAVLPMAGVFATDITQVTDTVQITIAATCTFDGETAGETEGTAAKTFSGSATNGSAATFTDSNVHTFSVTCNDNDGWKVTAGSPDNLSGATSGNDHVFTYTNDSLPTTGTEGSWTAIVGGDFSSDSTVTGIDSTTKAILTGGGIIATEKASAKTSQFTVSYSAYAGTETAADTYSGSIVYTLAALQ